MIIYVLHMIILPGLLALSWQRSRSLIDAHFLFTLMLVAHYSDYLVRGNDDPNIAAIPYATLSLYQMATLVSVAATIIVSFYMSNGNASNREKIGNVAQFSSNATAARTALLFGLTIIIVELVKRLIATDWHIDEVVTQMLGPRDMRAWGAVSILSASSMGKVNNPFFQLVSNILPLAGVGLAYAIVYSKGLTKVSAIFLYALDLFIIVTDGSRTPVFLAILSLVAFQLINSRSMVVKVASAILGIVAIATISSIMYLYRSIGFTSLASGGESVSVVYHQDDSIYRAWAAFFVADTGGYNWDPLYFFYTILANPIPRALWPDKPFLDVNYLGNFKIDYVTILYLGESVAMFGVYLGILFATLYAVILFQILQMTKRIVSKKLGYVAYFLIALWIYSCMRSIPNLTTTIYAPIAALIVVWLANRSQGGSYRQLARA